MLLSLLWPLLVVGIVAPGVAAWAVSMAPIGASIGEAARHRVSTVARELDTSHLPFDPWMCLYTNLHRLELAIVGGPRLVDRNEPAPPDQESPPCKRCSKHSRRP